MQVLLVSSPTRPNSWIIPAGKVETNEDCGTCALREAMEEAGACGRLGRFLGTYDHHDLKKRTCVFVLYVDRLMEDFMEKDRRKRQWFPINEAKKLLFSYKSQNCDYLNALQNSTELRNPLDNSSHETCVTRLCSRESGSKPIRILATDQLFYDVKTTNGATVS